jgi:hypothetical protein
MCCAVEREENSRREFSLVCTTALLLIREEKMCGQERGGMLLSRENTLVGVRVYQNL